jgi:hypothetical protein
MIQRIQTLWLAITIITAFLAIKQPLTILRQNSEREYLVDYNGIIKYEGKEAGVIQKELPEIKILLWAILLFSATAIFTYKYRKAQKLLSLLAAFIAIVLLIITVYQTAILLTSTGTKYQFSADDLLLLTLIVTPILAWRGIFKDEELVKSYDRLR